MAISGSMAKARRRTPTRAERVALGKALRRKVSRSSHAAWTPARDRTDPVSLLEESSRGRVARLLPIRFGRMAHSPFAYLRGAASVMAHDLASTPVTGLRVQLAGDAHVGNFGVFGTPERDRVFDVNDFDETLPGPWEWDLKRLATSLVVAGRSDGLLRPENRRAALAAVRSYRDAMAVFASQRYLDTWYFHLDRASIAKALTRRGREVAGRALSQARLRTAFRAFPRMVRTTPGGLRIREEPPLIVHYANHADAEESRTFYHRYLQTLPDERRLILERYQVTDVAQKVVGVGSVGTVCSIVLLTADRDPADPVFLQLKQALPSALEPYLGRSRYASHGERVVVGQHLIQEASDIFLGWSQLGSRDFYVRQLRDMKFASDIATFGPKALVGQGELCGAALARAHARTGDPSAISGYLGNRDLLDEAIADFAESYADQTERDHAALVRAIRRGRLPSEPDL